VTLDPLRPGLRAAASGAEALPASFYDRDTDLVARDLLGAVLQHGSTSGRIVEVEAYMGPHDPACHAAAGLTPRTAALFGPPGTAYVYFIYGMHWCVNAVTRETGYGAAVLIRALEPLAGLSLMRRRRAPAAGDRDLANGPGKLCAALGIDARLNGTSLQSGSLRILAAPRIPDRLVRVSARVGITKAAEERLRFYIADHPSVSRVPTTISASARHFKTRSAAAAQRPRRRAVSA
jgi:DNA-3-methyladenine glycosylase